MTCLHRRWCIAAASVAVLLFAWAIMLLQFRSPHMSWPALTMNAAVLIYIWALGPYQASRLQRRGYNNPALSRQEV